MAHQTGESKQGCLRVDFDRRLKLEFHGSRVTTDAGLLAYRELDASVELTAMAGDVLADSRPGKNGRHGMVGQFRQSVFGRLGGYDDVNDADRLSLDPVMRWIVGGHAVTKQAASGSQMGRFETEVLATGLWKTSPRLVVFPADGSTAFMTVARRRRSFPTWTAASALTHGAQEGSTCSTGTSVAPAIIPCSCSTSSAIWNGAPCVPATFTAPMAGARCWSR